MKQTKNKILIVDDDLTNQFILKETLNDYDLFFASEGSEAVDMTQKVLPDLILLDVMMPDISGHVVCKILKSNPTTSHIPIIFVSAMSEVDHETLGFSLGAVDYIVKPIRPAIVRARVKTHLSLIQLEEHKRTQMQIIQSLGFASEYRDNETGLHVIRVSHYSKILAQAIGYSNELVNEIFHAATLHDVGKIGVPDFILTKTGKLSSEEWEIIKKHPLIGAKILGEHRNGILKVAGDIIISHHEKWDGSGYPYGLKQEEICPEGRIVAIADVFDALTSERPYKHVWSVEDSCDYMQEQAGKHFDPKFFSLFIERLPDILEVMKQWKETVR